MNIKEYLDILKELWTPTNASKIRMSISNALEMMGNNLKENIDRQDNVENQFQDVLDETTGKDVINGPEIIAARNGEANLKARLDKEKNEVAAQLAQIAHQFVNVESMKNSNKLKVGDRVETWGYYSQGDGGNSKYIIVDDSTDYCETLSNGLKAELLHDGVVNVKQLGIISEDNTKKENNSTIFKNVADNFLYKFYFPKGEYYLSAISTTSRTVYIEGEQNRPYQDVAVDSVIYTEGEDFLTSTASGVAYYVNNMRFVSEGQYGKCFTSVNSAETILVGKTITIENFEYGFYAPVYSTGCYIDDLRLVSNMYGFYSEDSSHYSKISRLVINFNKIGVKINGYQCKLEQIHFGVGYMGRIKEGDDHMNIGLVVDQTPEIDGLYVEAYGADASNSIFIDFIHNQWDIGALTLKRVTFPGGGDTSLAKHIRMSREVVTSHEPNGIHIENSYVSDLKIVEKNNELVRGIKIDGKNTWSFPSSAGFNNYQLTVVSNGTLTTRDSENYQYLSYPITDIVDYSKMINADLTGQRNMIYNQTNSTLDIMDDGMYNVSFLARGKVINEGEYSFIVRYRTRVPHVYREVSIGSVTVGADKVLDFAGNANLYISRRGSFEIGLKKTGQVLQGDDLPNVNIELSVVPV